MILAHSTHTWLPLTEQWIYRQVKHLMGMEQFVLCDKRDNAFEELVKTFYNPGDGYDLKNRVKRRLGLPDQFRNKILKEYDDIILFSHYGVQGYNDLRLKKEKHITRFYGYDLNRTLQSDKRWHPRYKELFEQCDTFIVEGHHMKNVLHEMGCPENKIKISFLGTELHEIKFQQREESSVLNILIACATAERKGIIYSMKAIEKAIRNYKIPIHIHWVGARNSDYPEYIKYEDFLNDFIRGNDLKSFITHYGFLAPQQLYAVAHQCQIAIHPSVWAADGDCEGGYPVVLVDLMATGLPVISTLHCDIPEVVTMENGFLCEEKNVEELVIAIIDCYQSKSYISKSLLARKTVEEKFDWEILGKELSKIILS